MRYVTVCKVISAIVQFYYLSFRRSKQMNFRITFPQETIPSRGNFLHTEYFAIEAARPPYILNEQCCVFQLENVHLSLLLKRLNCSSTSLTPCTADHG